MPAAASWRTATRTPNTTRRSPRRKASLMQWKNYVYANGGFVPPDQAHVSIFDSGFLFGDGVFETMRVYGGKIFRFDQHMQRLFDGLCRLRIEPNVSPEKIREIFGALCEKEVAHGVARIYVTRGMPELN